MADPVGEAKLEPLRVDFDRRVKLEFHGGDISSDGGLSVRRGQLRRGDVLSDRLIEVEEASNLMAARRLKAGLLGTVTKSLRTMSKDQGPRALSGQMVPSGRIVL